MKPRKDEEMKMYRARFYGFIDEIEVVKETEKMVFLPFDEFWQRKPREAKRTDYTMICKTWDEAKAALVMHAKGKVEGAKGLLKSAENRLADAQAMVHP